MTPARLQIDDRAGSDRLGRYLRARRQPVDLCRLPFGDVAFTGQGPEGRPISVGVEYKIVTDALQCIQDGRFAGHQLPGLISSYEIPILLIEGTTRPDPKDGLLQIRHPHKGFWYSAKTGRNQFMYRDFQHWLMTLTFKAGIRIMFSSDISDTAATIVSLFTWFTAKEWKDHRSHLAMASGIDLNRDAAIFIRPSILRRVAAELPGIGLDRSAEVARKFRSIQEMSMADEKDWETIPGIGHKTAMAVCAALRGEVMKGNGKL